MFMNPDKYAILDRTNIHNALKAILPAIQDGNGPAYRKSQAALYVKFLKHCSDLQHQVKGPGPGPNGEWRIADIQQALFQYAQQGGKIV